MGSLWKFYPQRALSLSTDIDVFAFIHLSYTHALTLCASWDPATEQQQIINLFSGSSFTFLLSFGIFCTHHTSRELRWSPLCTTVPTLGGSWTSSFFAVRETFFLEFLGTRPEQRGGWLLNQAQRKRDRITVLCPGAAQISELVIIPSPSTSTPAVSNLSVSGLLCSTFSGNLIVLFLCHFCHFF